MLKRFAAVCLALIGLPVWAADPFPPPEVLAHYSGKVVYVDFWASWCAPCAESFPWLNTLQAKFGPNLVVVGVNVDEDPADADAFLHRRPASFDIVRDPKGEIAARYDIPGMPTSLLLDAEGHVIHRHSGFRRNEIPEYEAAISRALNTPHPAQGSQP